MQWENLTFRNISWEALEQEQARIIEKVKGNPSCSYLLVSEPESVFTAGKSATPQDLLWQAEELKKNGATTALVTRGGKWTYHGPGQLLVYPIVKLSALGYHSKAARLFVEAFREGCLNALRELGLTEVEKGEPFGLYVKGKKIVSFGLNFSQGIASSGLAVYYEPQSVFFKGINPCGSQGTSALTTSIRESLSTPISWLDVASCMTTHIKKHLCLGPTQVL